PAPVRVTGVGFVPGTGLVVAGLAKGTGGELRVWDAETLRVVRRAEVPGRVLGLAVNPVGGHVALACDDKAVRVVEPATGRTAFERPAKAAVNRVAFGPDGRRLAAGDQDGRIKTWEWAAGEELPEYRFYPQFDDPYAPILDLAFGPDEDTLLAAY